MHELKIDNILLRTVISSTIEGLAMTEAKLDPVGAARFLSTKREVSALVSLYGDQNGTMTINAGKGTTIWLASRLLGQDLEEFDDAAMDAMCELANMVAGRIKEKLRGTGFQFSSISVPALVVGSNYAVRYQRGIIGAAVEFEVADIPMSRMRYRFFATAISMMRR